VRGPLSWLRLAACAALLGSGAALSSGCLVFKTLHSVNQVQTIGDVIVTSTVCTPSTAAGSTCPRTGLSGFTLEDLMGNPSPPLQVLLAYRVPTGSQGPPSFTSTGQIVLSFAPNPSYAADLQRVAPAPPGQSWVGYASTSTLVFNPALGVREATVSVEFTLPPAADGGPFPSPLRYRPVVGLRGIDPVSAPATRPVACNSTDLSAETSLSEPTICVTDTGFALGSTAPRPIAFNESANVRDLGFPTAGVTGSANPGGLVSLPFIARYSGPASAAASFTLTASTTLPGATVTPALGTLVPAASSDNPVPVAVGIPAGAAPGSYGVTLTARLPNGLTRSGTGTVIVAALPGGGAGTGGTGATTRTKVTIILARTLSLGSVRRTGIRILVGATRAGRATVSLFAGRAKKPVVSKTVRLKAPGPVTVTLRSRRLAARTYRVVVKGTGFSATKSLRLKRR
jgi:hypothetical protein